MAGEPFISPGTMRGHVSGGRTRLGLRNRVEIAAWAREKRPMDTG
ncbi:helix-turn-helix domain-containing protein [Nocardiopsis halotolerans]|nr:hypothetical protein [Nocardiopsis halotolerans]